MFWYYIVCVIHSLYVFHPPSFHLCPLVTSFAKEVMFVTALVCLFVCLWTTLLKKLSSDWDEILWRGSG